eukprot:TRINITY_DN11136_c0_g2_i1.p1 TRINITY_DN11136_c0_g2~~TRINITY_DN11136_c0_g2_i1.p1  ORF type:complete len:747 (+),score=81.00 TRINITY_DN11136_c0_g2_i1:67-2241(+)
MTLEGSWVQCAGPRLRPPRVDPGSFQKQLDEHSRLLERLQREQAESLASWKKQHSEQLKRLALVEVMSKNHQLTLMEGRMSSMEMTLEFGELQVRLVSLEGCVKELQESASLQTTRQEEDELDSAVPKHQKECVQEESASSLQTWQEEDDVDGAVLLERAEVPMQPTDRSALCQILAAPVAFQPKCLEEAQSSPRCDVIRQKGIAQAPSQQGETARADQRKQDKTLTEESTEASEEHLVSACDSCSPQKLHASGGFDLDLEHEYEPLSPHNAAWADHEKQDKTLITESTEDSAENLVFACDGGSPQKLHASGGFDLDLEHEYEPLSPQNSAQADHEKQDKTLITESTEKSAENLVSACDGGSPQKLHASGGLDRDLEHEYEPPSPQKLQAIGGFDVKDGPLVSSQNVDTSKLASEVGNRQKDCLQVDTQATEGTASVHSVDLMFGPPPRAKKLDKPMCLEEALNLGRRCYPLPMSTYTSAFLDCLLAPSKATSGWVEWMARGCRAYFLHFFNLFLQIGCITLLGRMTLWHWNNMELVDCYQLEPVPLMCCIFCFLCSVINEVEECEDMLRILRIIIPTTTVTIPMGYSFDAGGNLRLVEGGMSAYRKTFLVLFVIAPRFLVAITVLVVGALYVAMSTSNTEMLLNCVALVFILDIDDLLFKTLASNEMVRLINAMPVFESDGSESAKGCIDWHKTQSARRLFFGLLLTISVFLMVPKCQRPISW